MNVNKEILKLNDLASTYKGGATVKFFAGDINDGVKDFIFKNCPYSKVGVIAFSSTYLKYGKSVSNALTSANAKCVSLIMPEKYSDSVDYAGLLFNLPEDIRAIVVIDRELMRVASYFSFIRNVPILYIPKDISFYKSLDDVLYFRNGGKTEKIVCKSKKYVVFDKNFLSYDNLALIYAHVVSKIVALFDYKIYKTITGEKINKTVLSAGLKIINETIKIMDVSVAERGDLLALNSLKTELLNFLTDGELFSYSAEVFTSKLLAGNSDFYSIELASAIKILAYYSDFFESIEAYPVFPNYNGRVEEVSRKIKIGEKELSDSFIKHTDGFFKDKKKYLETINDLSADAKKAFEVVANLKSTYLTLGGKERFGITEELLYDAVRYSGDVPFYFNGMTVLRELGILD